MSARSFEQVLQAAAAEGLVPAGDAPPPPEARPWPVVLLTALGAWLAAVPLIGVVGLLLGDLISRSAGPYVVGPLTLAAAVIVLRSRTVPAFFEQLAVPALIVGGGALAFGLFRDLDTAGGAAVLALVAAGIALVLPRPWLRVLLGAAAAVLVALACLPTRWTFSPSAHARFWLAWHIVFAAWAIALAVQRQAPARAAAALESIGAGWLLAALGGLAWWSGMTFLVGASAGGVAVDIAREIGSSPRAGVFTRALPAVSMALAAAAAWRMASAWPSLRRPLFLATAVVLIGLAGFMPALGAALWALAACAATQRLRLAGAAALACAWIVGAFYYQLAWPLATKALVLAGAGAALAGAAWWTLRRDGGTAARPAASSDRRAQAGIAATALLVLAVANTGIRQKEQLIAHGQPVFIELAPVDPRSLMQGDYMRLNFRVPSDVELQLEGVVSGPRPRLVARRDGRGVATLLRLDAGAPRAADELLIELTPKNGRWTVVTDAWFFAEGEEPRWSRARFGEFRVDAEGKALLVGLRGERLEAL
jgi:uncharacterized membrane-anchored protein